MLISSSNWLVLLQIKPDIDRFKLFNHWLNQQRSLSVFPLTLFQTKVYLFVGNESEAWFLGHWFLSRHGLQFNCWSYLPNLGINNLVLYMGMRSLLALIHWVWTSGLVTLFFFLVLTDVNSIKSTPSRLVGEFQENRLRGLEKQVKDILEFKEQFRNPMTIVRSTLLRDLR